MHPFFDILGHQISGYAVMGLIGFAAAVLFLLIMCRRARFSFDDAIYIFVIAMIGVMIGAKILYLITALPEIVSDWTLITSDPFHYIGAYFSGGMVFYGGLLGGLLAAAWAARYFHIDLPNHFDIFVPAIPLFAGFGRMGCLMEGCCYGKETDSVCHVVFQQSLFAPNNVPLIPTQLYEAIFDFALFVVLVFAGRKQKRIPRLLTVYLFSYASFRFLIEFFRGDLVRGVWFLSTSQWISVSILIFLAVKRQMERKRVQIEKCVRKER